MIGMADRRGAEPEEFAVRAGLGWFDGEVAHAGPVTVHVRHGRIVGLAKGNDDVAVAARDLPLIEGAYLMPGLVDAHVHLFLDGGPTDGATRSAHLKQSFEALAEAARASARQALSHGVTRVRDAGDRHGINHRIREEARGGKTGMCRVHSGGSGIKRARRYGAFMARDVDDLASIRESVADLARSNDEIKLILTGIIDFEAGAVTDEPQFTLDEAELVVATATAHGRRTFAHCSGEMGLAIAARAGVGSIEHGFFMNREILSIMRDRRVAWTPTFCPVHFQWSQPGAVGWSLGTVGNLRRILDSHAEHLRLAHEMGVTILLGTDAGSMGVEHGKGVVEEIRRYTESGVSLLAALTAATATNRRHFGLSPTLGVGAPFEAQLLPASPFEDREVLGKPSMVWLGTEE